MPSGSWTPSREFASGGEYSRKGFPNPTGRIQSDSQNRVSSKPGAIPVAVIVSTRVPNGRVLPVYGFKGGGKTLKDAGAVMADNLSPQKARILAMLALQKTSDPAELQKLFDR